MKKKEVLDCVQIAKNNLTNQIFFGIMRDQTDNSLEFSEVRELNKNEIFYYATIFVDYLVEIGKTKLKNIETGYVYKVSKDKNDEQGLGYGNVKQYQNEIDRLETELAHCEEDLIHADEKVFYREMAVKLDEDKIKKQADKGLRKV